MTTVQKITAALATLFVVAVLLIAYQALVVVPAERLEAQAELQRAEQRAQELAELKRQADYNNCLAAAYEVYSANWESKCKVLGLGDGCTLTVYAYAPIEEDYANEKDRCVTMYK